MHMLHVLEGFVEEAEKTALSLEQVKGFANTAKNVASPLIGGRATGLGLSAGALLGGALEGGYRGHQAYKETKEQGGDAGIAALQGTMAGLGGVMSGASKGALLGAGAGALATHVNPNMLDKITPGGHLDSMMRFGQRQIHGVTGVTPQVLGPMTHKGAVRAIGSGAHYAVEAEQNARTAYEQAQHAYANRAPGTLADANKKLDAAEAAHRNAQNIREHAEAAEAAGLDSAPGYFKGLLSSPVQTLRRGISETWHGNGSGASGMVGKGMLLGSGLYAASTLPGAISGEQPLAPGLREGAGRGERIGHLVGNTAGMVVGAPLSLAGQGVLSKGLEVAGSTAGRVVDNGVSLGKKLYNAVNKPQPAQEAPAVQAPGVVQ